MTKGHMAIFVSLWVLGIILIGLVNACNNNTSAYAHSFSPNSLSTLDIEYFTSVTKLVLAAILELDELNQ